MSDNEQFEGFDDDHDGAIHREDHSGASWSDPQTAVVGSVNELSSAPEGNGVFTTSPRVASYGESVETIGSMSNNDLYRFTLVDGQVRGLQEFDDGRWKNERISRNETWTFDGTTLVQTETKRGRVKTSSYTDLDGDGLFSRAGRDAITGSRTDGSRDDSDNRSSYFDSTDGYRFALVDGQVSGLQQFDDGRWKNERIDRNESWTFDGTNLVQEEFKRNGVEVSTYSDPNSDGIFTKTSEIWNPSSTLTADSSLF